MFFAVFLSILALASAGINQLGVNQCKCRVKTAQKIVGGQVSIAHAYPWQISITDLEKVHLCSGVIINQQWVATAISCVEKLKPEEFYIRVGVHNLTEATDESLIHYVEEIKTNEVQHAALIKLKNSISFVEDLVEPACINEWFTVYDEPLTATGWGTTSKTIKKEFSKTLEIGTLSDVLKEVSYYVDYTVDCVRQFICAKQSVKEESVCDGDEGGPIHYTLNGRTTVEGLLHPLEMKQFYFNKNYCIGEAKFISLYDCRKWIEKTVGKEFCLVNRESNKFE